MATGTRVAGVSDTQAPQVGRARAAQVERARAAWQLARPPLDAADAGVGDVGPYPVVGRVDAVGQGASPVCGPDAPQVPVAQAGQRVVAVVDGAP